MRTRFDPGTRRILRGLVAASALAAGACAAPRRSGGQPEEGFEFRPAPEPQQPAVAAGRLEVIEFFWYGCPHCHAMEPVLARWRVRQPPDVVFRKLHAGLGPRWTIHQRLFFALQRLDADEAVNARVFQSIHVDGKPIDTRDAAADLAVSAGLSRPAFLSAWDSPATDAAIRDADALGQALGISGVPALAVQGRWVTTPTMAGSYAEALAVVDVLLERERAAARTGAGAAKR